MKSLRVVGTAALICLWPSVCASAAPAKKAEKASLPIFEFKGMKAGEPIDMSQLSGCQQKEGQVECSSADRTVAGYQTYIAPSYYLVDGKLSSMFLLFEDKAYPSLLSALIQKYGPPCKSEIRKWQNKAGSTFDNPVTTWCFKTGTLEIHEMSIQRDYSHIEYNDAVTKPKLTPAKVDF